jgi:hypothetical protein
MSLCSVFLRVRNGDEDVGIQAFLSFRRYMTIYLHISQKICIYLKKSAYIQKYLQIFQKISIKLHSS